MLDCQIATFNYIICMVWYSTDNQTVTQGGSDEDMVIDSDLHDH